MKRYLYFAVTSILVMAGQAFDSTEDFEVLEDPVTISEVASHLQRQSVDFSVTLQQTEEELVEAQTGYAAWVNNQGQ